MAASGIYNFSALARRVQPALKISNTRIASRRCISRPAAASISRRSASTLSESTLGDLSAEDLKFGQHLPIASSGTRRESEIPLSVQLAYLRPLRRKPTHRVPTCNLQLRSYSVRNLEFFTTFALRAAYYLNLPAVGPVPLPKQIERWTVPRGHFVHKKSQENFERITLRRMIQIQDGHPETVQIWLAYLRKRAYYGVGMKANVWEFDKLGESDVFEMVSTNDPGLGREIDVDAEPAQSLEAKWESQYPEQLTPEVQAEVDKWMQKYGDNGLLDFTPVATREGQISRRDIVQLEETDSADPVPQSEALQKDENEPKPEPGQLGRAADREVHIVRENVAVKDPMSASSKVESILAQIERDAEMNRASAESEISPVELNDLSNAPDITEVRARPTPTVKTSTEQKDSARPIKTQSEEQLTLANTREVDANLKTDSSNASAAKSGSVAPDNSSTLPTSANAKEVNGNLKIESPEPEAQDTPGSAVEQATLDVSSAVPTQQNAEEVNANLKTAAPEAAEKTQQPETSQPDTEKTQDIPEEADPSVEPTTEKAKEAEAEDAEQPLGSLPKTPS